MRIGQGGGHDDGRSRQRVERKAPWKRPLERSPSRSVRYAMSFLTMLVIGLLVGIVAKFLLPGDDPGGFIVTTFIGILGSVVAGYIGRAAGWYTEGQTVGFIASVGGAIVLLLIYRLLFRRRKS
jgi:uncharacterized membrane protein YeaQ/YmgE (transglycosylase-associated protein family)